MIEIPFNSDDIRAALNMGKELGQLKDSITKGKGNAAGYLGEISIANHIKANIVSCEVGRAKYDRDLIKYKGESECSFEVKTKRRSVKPKLNYDASVAKTSKHQNPDYYLFLSIYFKWFKGAPPNRTYFRPLSVWFCGFMERDEYFKKATLWKRGDVDKSNDFTTKVDMYNLPYSELIDSKEFFNIFK